MIILEELVGHSLDTIMPLDELCEVVGCTEVSTMLVVTKDVLAFLCDKHTKEYRGLAELRRRGGDYEDQER